jgi:hypothetical protein
MKRREEEVLNSLLSLSGRTRRFIDPELIMIGGYAFRKNFFCSIYVPTISFH